MKNIKILLSVIVIAGVGAVLYSGNINIKDTRASFEGKVYVAVEDSGDIAVLDAKTNQIVKRIDLSEDKNGVTVGYAPHNVQVSPDNKSVWVTANVVEKKMKTAFRLISRAEAHGDEAEVIGSSKDEVIVIDPFSDAVVKRIELGQNLHLSHVALTSEGSYAIVASQEKGILYKINTTSYEVEKELLLKNGSEPHGMRLSPDGRFAYVAMMGGKSLGILDVAKFTISNIPLKGIAVQTGVTPDGVYALASIYDTKSLAVYHILSGQLSYVDLPKEAKGPVQIFAAPDSRFVYVADQGLSFGQPEGSMIYKVDLKDMSVVGEIKGGRAPHGIAVSQDGMFAYVTNSLSGDVSVINTVTQKEIKKTPVGINPNGISIWYSNGLRGEVKSEGKGNYSELVPEEKSFDLGTVSMAKGKVAHSFSVKNVGSSPVKITKISTSCMCTEATLVIDASRKGPFGMPGHGGLSSLNEIVTPGQEISIEVTVDPAAHGPQGAGPAKKAVYIETDSALTPTLKLSLDINVTP